MAAPLATATVPFELALIQARLTDNNVPVALDLGEQVPRPAMRETWWVRYVGTEYEAAPQARDSDVALDTWEIGNHYPVDPSGAAGSQVTALTASDTVQKLLTAKSWFRPLGWHVRLASREAEWDGEIYTTRLYFEIWRREALGG